MRGILARDIIGSLGVSEREATSLVDRWLIGLRKPSSGSEAIAASPDAVRSIGLTLRWDAAPAKPAEWRSACELSRCFVGDTRAINRKLTELRAALVAELQEAGDGRRRAARPP